MICQQKQKICSTICSSKFKQGEKNRPQKRGALVSTITVEETDSALSQAADTFHSKSKSFCAAHQTSMLRKQFFLGQLLHDGIDEDFRIRKLFDDRPDRLMDGGLGNHRVAF